MDKKELNRLAQERYRNKHRELVNTRHREWYQRNRDRVLAEQKELNKANPEKRKEVCKRYYEKNKEKCLKAGQDYRAKDSVKEKRRLWAVDNRQKPEVKERLKKQRKKYLRSDKGKSKVKAYTAKRKPYFEEYRKTESRKATITNYYHKRRAKTTVTDIDTKWLKALKQKTSICELCNKEMENTGNYPNGKHLDHILPLNVGGEHKKNNVRYICAECNVARPKDGSDLLKLVV